MHRLDPTTTVLTAALALMTAFALASETPFSGVRGRVTPPVSTALEAPARVRVEPGAGWVALNATAVATLPPRALNGR